MRSGWISKCAIAAIGFVPWSPSSYGEWPPAQDSPPPAIDLEANNAPGSGQDQAAKLRKELEALTQEVRQREILGRPSMCANQIAQEAHWLLNSTWNYGQVAGRLADLKATLALPDPEAAMLNDRQSPADGSWGRCYHAWWLKLVTSFDHLTSDPQPLPYPPRFLDQINSPAQLTSYLEGLLTSNPGYDGKDNRRELNETVSVLMRLILRGNTGYPFHPGLKQAMLDFVNNRLRDPATGLFGPFVIERGRPVRKDDLSISFHVISYLKGKVRGWPRILDAVLRIKDGKYPEGWLVGGRLNNHNDMDVVDLFEHGWKHASEGQKNRMRTEIRRMLDFCLHSSMDAAGNFALTPVDQTHETATYFGVSFLARIGYFDPSKRFWTDESFPDADALKQKLIARIRQSLAQGNTPGFFYKNALKALGVSVN